MKTTIERQEFLALLRNMYGYWDDDTLMNDEPMEIFSLGELEESIRRAILEGGVYTVLDFPDGRCYTLEEAENLETILHLFLYDYPEIWHKIRWMDDDHRRLILARELERPENAAYARAMARVAVRHMADVQMLVDCRQKETLYEIL